LYVSAIAECDRQTRKSKIIVFITPPHLILFESAAILK
jgi:hypothetical protein